MSEPTLRDRLLSSPATPAGEFVLSGSGLTVYIRRWTLREQMRVFAVSDDKTRPPLERVADYLRLILCDAANRRLFDDDGDVSDVTITPAEVNALVAQAIRDNGMGGEGDGEKKASAGTGN